MWLIVVGVFLTLLILFSYRLSSLRWKRGYWTQRGILEIDVSSEVTELDVLLGKKDITQRDDYIYKILARGNLKFCGVLENPSPIILVKDVDLIKKILIKDFDHFIDRRLFFGAAREDSVLRKMLGNLQGDEWKRVRSSVSPTFTTGKIRRMMGCINAAGLDWVKQLSANCEEETNRQLKINVYNCVRQYTSDVIASAIFGLEPTSVKNPHSTFSTMASRLTDMSTFQAIKFTLSLRFPKLFQVFNIDILDMEALHFFEVILKKSLGKRINGEVVRDDFLQLLVEAWKGESEKSVGTEHNHHHKYLTDSVMSGQCLSFFFAGFRTTSHFITFAMYALAVHKDVQDKLREELEQISTKSHDGQLDYDDLGKLAYLDMVMCEVLRLFPATLRLERTCVSEYHDSETGLCVPKGVIVAIPLNSIHHDLEFYEKPYEFYPEHFLPEKKEGRIPYAFMPFGAGPRNCIGMRFASVESKAAVVSIVQNFIIEPTQSTPIPLRGRRVNFQICPPPNLELILIPRKGKSVEN